MVSNEFGQLVLLVWFVLDVAFLAVMIITLIEVLKLSKKQKDKQESKSFSMQDCKECAEGYKNGNGYCWRHSGYFKDKEEYNEKVYKLSLYKKRDSDTPKKVFIPYFVYKEVFDSSHFVPTKEYSDKWICEAILYYRYRNIHKEPPKG